MINQEVNLRSRCKSMIYNPTVKPWHDIKPEIVNISKFHFGQCTFSEDELRADFTDPKCVAIISTDTFTGGIIGYAYTTSLLKYSDNMDLDLPRSDKGENTAYLWQIALAPDYTGHRLVEDITGTLEYALTEKGYKYLELSARVENGYAAKFAKNNQRRILHQNTFIDEYSGEKLTFFRVDLCRSI